MRPAHRTTLGLRSLPSLRLGLALGAAAAAAVLATASPSTARPGTAAHPMSPRTTAPRTVRPAPAAGSGLLQYFGGPVQHHPTVYLLFWGSQWTDDSNGVRSYLQNFFSSLGTADDSWSRVTSQYHDSSGLGPTFDGPVLHGTWVDSSAPAPQSATAAQIAAEATAGAQHFGISGTDIQMFVVSPSGTHPDGFPDAGFCAWHDYNGTVPYINLPYVLDAGSSCGANSVRGPLDGFSIVAGHEYIDTITDPVPGTGWVVPTTGEEAADVCAWQSLTTLTFTSGSFSVEPIWSNARNACVTS